jgi:hypothetical protein
MEADPNVNTQQVPLVHEGIQHLDIPSSQAALNWEKNLVGST